TSAAGRPSNRYARSASYRRWVGSAGRAKNSPPDLGWGDLADWTIPIVHPLGRTEPVPRRLPAAGQAPSRPSKSRYPGHRPASQQSAPSNPPAECTFRLIDTNQRDHPYSFSTAATLTRSNPAQQRFRDLSQASPANPRRLNPSRENRR